MTDDLVTKFAIPEDFSLPEVKTKPKTSGAKHFIPALPLQIVKISVLAECEIALPLILTIHRQLTMTGREWTPLNKAIWDAAGNPPEKKRSKILAVLKRHPDLIQIRPKKTTTSHYEVAYGALWAAEASAPPVP
jgi:hypothetical protein